MIVVISPHIDDAVLSLGGILLKSNVEIKVKYIFSISKWTNPKSISGLTYPMDEETITKIRKKEEERVSQILRYNFEYFDLKDSSLRKASGLKEVQAKIRRWINMDIGGNSELFFPLGMSHEDHIIINKIGIELFNQGVDVNFYEEMPYMSMYKGDYREIYSRLIDFGMTPNTESIDFKKKIEVLRNYGSQMSEEWFENIQRYSYNPTNNNYYERYWKISHADIKFIDPLEFGLIWK